MSGSASAARGSSNSRRSIQSIDSGCTIRAQQRELGNLLNLRQLRRADTVGGDHNMRYPLGTQIVDGGAIGEAAQNLNVVDVAWRRKPGIAVQQRLPESSRRQHQS